MRKYHKTQCMDILSLMEKAHDQVMKYIEKKQIAEAVQLLEVCQQGAIQVGTFIDRLEGENTEAVRILEKYCEAAYQFHEELLSGVAVTDRQVEKELGRSITAEKNELRNNIPTQYEAVFLPYKASMWDSMESIWMAADADPNCRAYVVPIPYFDRNPDGSFSKMHYEAEDYPDYVPVVHYSSFNLEEHHPDMIFIHNPYDEYNYVTSVHPDFYSKRLKEFTYCLVYVPYYATSGKMAEGQSFCSAYVYADYIVVQSKAIIDQFDPRIPREKFLPLGSPKFDRVIRFCQNPPEPPEDWKRKMEGKRVYFYNTSIAGMLENTENFLKKMRYVFDTFKETDDACILWRPHPLLQSTFESMRRDYLEEYDALVRYFKEENIGIYDDTPDIEVSIALSDAYIGDAGTSVISLFEAASKEVFILDNHVYEKPAKDAWKGIYTVYPTKDARFNKVVCMPDDKLFWSPENDLKYEFFCDLPKDENHWGYVQAFTFGGNTYVFPRNAQEILIVNEDREIRRIGLRKYDRVKFAFDRALVFGEEYAFLIPNEYPAIVRYSFKDGKTDYIEGVGDSIWTRVDGEKILCGCGFSGRYRKLFFCDSDGETILSIDMDYLQTEHIKTGFGRVMYSVIPENWSVDQYYWLLPMKGTKAIRWDYINNTYREYDLEVDGLYSFDSITRTNRDSFYFSSIAVLDNEIIAAPRRGNKFVKLNIIDGSTEEWRPGFPVYMRNKAPWYLNWDRGWFVWDMTGHACGYANSPERITYDIDFSDNSTKPVEFEIKEDDIREHYIKGFVSESKILPICCRESPWNSMEMIAANRIAGTAFDEKRQKEQFSYISADTEGICGRKIYEHVRDNC